MPLFAFNNPTGLEPKRASHIGNLTTLIIDKKQKMQRNKYSVALILKVEGTREMSNFLEDINLVYKEIKDLSNLV